LFIPSHRNAFIDEKHKNTCKINRIKIVVSEIEIFGCGPDPNYKRPKRDMNSFNKRYRCPSGGGYFEIDENTIACNFHGPFLFRKTKLP
jgi:hypothetical protein